MPSLLPPNATPQETAIANTLARLSDVPVPVRATVDPEQCPESMLPWLAWGYSVDAWDAASPAYVKRWSVMQSLLIHRRKGTVAALRDAAAAIGVPVEFEEWHRQSPQGAPYTFRALVNSIATPLTQTDIQRLLAAIEANKNLRSHLTELVPGVTSYSQAAVASVTAHGHDRQVRARYSDISLLLEGIENGEDITAAAVDRLHLHIHTTMPQQEQATP
ncbi:phage tail protein I [Stenotrophomonas sp. MMGLT7]|uniref:phage tail protein I n=1 Tax=Stenotrophomonas sp. MMGLT7 TaxID=2901227 RepID=UPI001E3B98E3|nr:phage tail protein I [Stenotrophomonas sp. MMGLT7]MCD7096985.1 phage tail protein I [Stenotrophomonas sp. MMGLT7]